eukprot:TRINITY_DN28446_c0_g1_i1.p2 TRINITY_DN28446_c0_g1~~TRINITY_DN28446_c0_g1_i1.p2  ORF type:complete len:186 (-),score=47.36 TRINITY_DN28446_c0_g1_i1:438-995(-)
MSLSLLGQYASDSDDDERAAPASLGGQKRLVDGKASPLDDASSPKKRKLDHLEVERSALPPPQTLLSDKFTNSPTSDKSLKQHVAPGKPMIGVSYNAVPPPAILLKSSNPAMSDAPPQSLENLPVPSPQATSRTDDEPVGVERRISRAAAAFVPPQLRRPNVVTEDTAAWGRQRASKNSPQQKKK